MKEGRSFCLSVLKRFSNASGNSEDMNFFCYIYLCFWDFESSAPTHTFYLKLKNG